MENCYECPEICHVIYTEPDKSSDFYLLNYGKRWDYHISVIYINIFLIPRSLLFLKGQLMPSTTAPEGPQYYIFVTYLLVRNRLRQWAIPFMFHTLKIFKKSSFQVLAISHLLLRSFSHLAEAKWIVSRQGEVEQCITNEAFRYWMLYQEEIFSGIPCVQNCSLLQCLQLLKEILWKSVGTGCNKTIYNCCTVFF